MNWAQFAFYFRKFFHFIQRIKNVIAVDYFYLKIMKGVLFVVRLVYIVMEIENVVIVVTIVDAMGVFDIGVKG